MPEELRRRLQDLGPHLNKRVQVDGALEADTNDRPLHHYGRALSRDDQYTAPIVIAPSSTETIFEFQSDHFGYV